MIEVAGFEVTMEAAVYAAATVLVLSAAAGVVASVLAFVHRLYSRQASSDALNVLAGLGAIALWLNMTGGLGHFVEGETDLTQPGVVFVNVASLAVGSIVSMYGGRLGDRLAVEAGAVKGVASNGDVSAFVRARGRNIRVELPEDIEDVDGYDPVDPEVRDQVAGQELVFPRGLTVEELHRQVVQRLKDEFDVGYVDLELGDDGEVEFLGLGSRVSGLGPTLGPGTCAVAVEADPAFAASPGDVVQLWKVDGDEPERVAVGELRGAAADVVTLVLDEADAADVTPDERYRVVTLPAEKSAEKELAAMLRSADETMAAFDIEEGDALTGVSAASLGVPVVAVEGRDGEVEAVPAGDRVFEPGDRLYVVGRPDQLRKLGDGVG